MAALPLAQILHRRGTWSGPAETCALDYESRFLRRKRLTTGAGRDFVVDLAQTTSLDDGDALALPDGTLVEIRAAEEAVLVVTGPALARLTWHIGNRHTPCQIEADRLLIRRDPVIRDMLLRLGADLREDTAPFTPEGGAYGQGRTHSHDHGHVHLPADAHGH